MRHYSQGSVHGRFQPLHNGHLKYILGAKQYCDFLWVGVTQYNIHSLLDSPEDPHRRQQVHNPMTYFERVEMITNALLDSGLARNEFYTIPFPIEIPDCLPDFLPISVPVFTTIYDKWNRHKIEILKAKGYKVIILWEESMKLIDGIRIRELIYIGDKSWKGEVPTATVKIIEKYGIEDRIRKLRDTQ